MHRHIRTLLRIGIVAILIALSWTLFLKAKAEYDTQFSLSGDGAAYTSSKLVWEYLILSLLSFTAAIVLTCHAIFKRRDR